MLFHFGIILGDLPQDLGKVSFDGLPVTGCDWSLCGQLTIDPTTSDACIFRHGESAIVGRGGEQVDRNVWVKAAIGRWVEWT